MSESRSVKDRKKRRKKRKNGMITEYFMPKTSLVIDSAIDCLQCVNPGKSASAGPPISKSSKSSKTSKSSKSRKILNAESAVSPLDESVEFTPHSAMFSDQERGNGTFFLSVFCEYEVRIPVHGVRCIYIL